MGNHHFFLLNFVAALALTVSARDSLQPVEGILKMEQSLQPVDTMMPMGTSCELHNFSNNTYCSDWAYNLKIFILFCGFSEK
jgi:hypothetical protein